VGTIRPSQRVGTYEITALTTGRFKENAYVVVATGDCLLVDPGAEPEFIESFLRLHALTPQRIVLTHGHFDHLGAVSTLMTQFSIPCAAHRLEERLVRQAATYAFRFDRGGAAVTVPRGLAFFDGTSDLDWNGRSIGVLAMPGHTAGSVALVLDGAAAFVGDTLFYERIGPTTYPESDPAAIDISVATLLDTLPSPCIIFPGHGKPWSVERARIWWSNLPGAPPSLSIF
jgi:hydroxyacylglutathione hydrolase